MPLVRLHIGGILRAYVCASIKTLCAIASVKKERFALLDLGELVPQTFDLQRRFSSVLSMTRKRKFASGGATNGGRVAIFDSTLVSQAQRTQSVV